MPCSSQAGKKDKMLDAGISELRHSFSVLSKAAEGGASPPHFLLLFYAVECGLKACILKDNSKLKLSQINKDLVDIYTHDLSYLVKKLRIVVGETNFRVRSGNSYTIKYAHQAWRYGIAIQEEDEKKMIEWLKKVQAKIKQRI